MVKTLSKKRSSAKYDVIVKAKATNTRIVDINNEIVRLETNGKGQVTGRYYSGVHWDTVESTILSDGSAMLAIKYLHVTKNGESIAGTGTGTQSSPKKEELQRLLLREPCGHLLLSYRT